MQIRRPRSGREQPENKNENKHPIHSDSSDSSDSGTGREQVENRGENRSRTGARSRIRFNPIHPIQGRSILQKHYVGAENKAENRAENRVENRVENKDPIHIRFTPIQGLTFRNAIEGTRTPPLRFRGKNLHFSFQTYTP